MFGWHLGLCLGLTAVMSPWLYSQNNPLADALDTPGWQWQAGGDIVWKRVDAAEAAGGSVAEVRLTGPAGGWFGADCLTSWMETTVTGPGTLAIDVRHNHNPYTQVSLLVDGVEAEVWQIEGPGGEAPNSGFGEWRRLSAAVPDGDHTVRVLHEFGCHGVGTLYINQPAVQADNARLIPPLTPAALDAIDVPNDEIWLAGGSVDFLPLMGPEAYDGVDALRAPAVAAGPAWDRPEPAWLIHAVAGPATLTWWERGHLPTPNQPWESRVLFIPPGTHSFFWQAYPDGQDIDAITRVTAPEVTLQEALDANDRTFTQSGPVWLGVSSAAAPDGQDAAWVRVTNKTDATLETTVNGPAAMSFRFSLDAAIETGGNLAVSINDRSVPLLGTGMTAIVPAGPHRVRWTASAPVFASGPATVMLDAVRATPATELTLGEALDAPELAWSSGPVPWTGLATSASPDGVDACVPPDLAAGESAWVETSVSGPGRLSFRWPLADQSDYSSATTPLRLIIDGQQILDQSVFQSAPTVEVGPGMHTFRWVATGQPSWRLSVLDQVLWEPLPSAPRLVALGSLSGPVAVPDESRAVVTTEVSHDGVDAIRLLPTGVLYSWLSSPSITTWIQGPGHLYYWYRPTNGASLMVNQAPAPEFNRDGDWRRGILAIPPGWRQQTWTVTPSVSLGAVPTVGLDGLEFSSASPIPLNAALPGAGPWSTSPEAPWVGLPADFILNTFSSAQASPAASSWLETEVTGPSVIVFSAMGQSLDWRIDGKIAGTPANGTTALSRYSVFVPEGTHSVRWVAQGLLPATLATVSLHPVSGPISIETAGETALIRVPRPIGFRDSQISLQYAAPISPPPIWFREFGARVHSTSAEAVVFSVPMESGASRLWRAAYSSE